MLTRRLPVAALILGLCWAGGALAQTPLGEILQPAEVAQVVRERWKKGVERNLFAFEAGLKAEAPERVAP